MNKKERGLSVEVDLETHLLEMLKGEIPSTIDTNT